MPKRLTGISMENSSEYEWDIYQETPIMSTYTVGIVITNDFKYSEGSTENRKERKIRSWVRSSAKLGHGPTKVGWKNITEENLGYTEKFITFYEDYFNITDILPKVDSIETIDAWHQGMENWGVIVYPGLNRFISQYTIAHETAHFWFGNLVTSKNFAE